MAGDPVHRGGVSRWNLGRTHALSGLVAGVAAGHFWWHLDAPHLAVAAAVTAGAAVLPEPLTFTTGTLPERWVVAPAMVVALGWLVAVIEKVVPAGRLPLRCHPASLPLDGPGASRR